MPSTESSYGVRESPRTNTVMVILKIGILAFFVILGFSHIDGDNFSPFFAKGTGGMVDAAALIFFAYIGFDAISTSGEEAQNPNRDLPIAIIGALLICTLIYIKIGAGYSWAGDILSLGALIAITW